MEIRRDGRGSDAAAWFLVGMMNRLLVDSVTSYNVTAAGLSLFNDDKCAHCGRRCDGVRLSSRILF